VDVKDTFVLAGDGSKWLLQECSGGSSDRTQDRRGMCISKGNGTRWERFNKYSSSRKNAAVLVGKDIELNGKEVGSGRTVNMRQGGNAQ